MVIGVDNNALKLKPGMTANATVIVAEAKDVIKIPNAALRFRPPLPEKDSREKPGATPKRNNKNEGNVVYVLVKNGKIKSIPVEIGVSDNSFTELVKGDLKVGELVAVGLSSKGKSFDMPSRRLL